MKKIILTIFLFLLIALTSEAQDRNPDRVHFAWGAEAGSSIDLSAHDMSSIDFNAFFGLEYKWFDFIGVGAGADIMISNSCRSYPIFLSIRSDFSKEKKLIFADLRGGIVMNYLPDNISQSDLWLSPGVGINLAGGKTFQSYIVVSYTYLGRKDVRLDSDDAHPYPSLNLASIRLGIKF